ncbi:hypothetical protein BCR36DRAFT_403452 [Piromyces finnis]|uniref:HMG box domain-containing protein n=1 Tax=Piromyces finnis TaxID=1754191 RepID=A0A1Y1VF09_9FUNG|nr:hypothetical protein BCR36DRAFT_403452 [Piromyces finnis]|eukprot:ORX53782.1 hypothetical protein BCR36DRAFT_403452 [Piromyces finnis]
MTKTLSQEEQKYKRKYEELFKKLQDLEENNKTLDLKIIKTRKCIKRLKVERGFLFEKLEKIKKPTDFDSDDSEIENNPPPQIVKVEEKHQKKKQKNIDPLAPKKPANAFFRFCQLQRKDLKSQIKNEDSSNSDITKILSNKWKELPQEKKQIDYDMYEIDKARYEKELEAYNINSEHKKGITSPLSKGKIKGRTKGKGSINATSKIRMNSISTTDDNIDDSMNSVNDNQTENSFNNANNNDDEDEMQVDDIDDVDAAVAATASDSKNKLFNEKQQDEDQPINDENNYSRSTSVEYSGETAQSNVDSNLDDTNTNDHDEDNEEEEDDDEEEEEEDNDDDDHENHGTNIMTGRMGKKFSIDSQDEIEENHDDVDSNTVEEEDEEVEEEEDDETEDIDEDTQLEEEEEEDDDDENKDE